VDIKYAKAVLEVKLDTILQYTWLQLYQLNYVLGKNESMFCWGYVRDLRLTVCYTKSQSRHLKETLFRKCEVCSWITRTQCTVHCCVSQGSVFTELRSGESLECCCI